jgi:O-antigen/teichoic acid export membrane protein
VRIGTLVAINVVSLALSFIARVLLARLIGPTAFGRFGVWYNNVQLFGLIGMYGQQNHTLRSLALSRSKSHDSAEAAGTIIRLTALTGLLSGTAGLAFYRLLHRGAMLEGSMLLSAVLFFSLSSVLSVVHRSLGYQVVGALFDRIVPQVLVAMAVGLAVAGGWNELRAELLFALALFAGLAASLALLAATNRAVIAYVLRPGALLRHLAPALPFFCSSLALALNLRYFLVLSGIFFEGAILGELALLYTLSSLILVPATTINLAAGPWLARTFATADVERCRLAAMLYLGAVLVSAAAFALVLAIAYPELPEQIGYGQLLPFSVIGLVIISSFFGAAAIGGSFLHQMAGSASRGARITIAVIIIKIPAVVLLAQFSGLLAMAAAEASLSLIMGSALVWRLWYGPAFERSVK